MEPLQIAAACTNTAVMGPSTQNLKVLCCDPSSKMSNWKLILADQEQQNEIQLPTDSLFLQDIGGFCFPPGQSCIFKGTDANLGNTACKELCACNQSSVIGNSLDKLLHRQIFPTLLHELWELCFIWLREVLKMVQLRFADRPGLPLVMKVLRRNCQVSMDLSQCWKSSSHCRHL